MRVVNRNETEARETVSAPTLSERGEDNLVASAGEWQGRRKDVSRFQIGTVNELCDTVLQGHGIM